MAIRKVLIVGGGIGGLTAAIAFRQQGIDVDLVELQDSFKVYHVGIIVQANTIRAMKHIGLADRIVEAGFPYRGVQMCDAEGTVLSHVQGPRIAGEQYPSDLGMGRPALHKVLTEAMSAEGCGVRLGVTFTAIDDLGDTVRVSFSDGEVRDYDLVIGADGINSSVRRTIFGEEHKPEFTGQGVWRYNVPRPAMLDVAALYIGKDYKAGFVPLTKETMYILLVTPEPGNPMLPQDQLADLMRQRLEGFGGLIGEARDHHITDSDMVVYRPLEAIFMPRPWSRGRVVMLGDAVHATSPHLGQGAAQAIEDAIVLAEEAGRDQPLAMMFANYEDRRYERCKFVVEASLMIGQWELTHDPAADHAGIRRQMLETLARPI